MERRAGSDRRRSSVEAEPQLELAAVGVVAPERLGDVVGLVVAARGDPAGDRGVADVDALASASSSCSIRA